MRQLFYRQTVPSRFAFSDNFPPKIVTESNVINVTLYETVELKITAVDNDTITFRVVNDPAGAIVNKTGNELFFSWNVTSSQKVGYHNVHLVNLVPMGGIIRDSVVTRMDTLKSGWTHYVYYTTHMFSSVFCLIL